MAFFGPASFAVNFGIETDAIFGTDGDDTLWGRPWSNLIDGGDGDDTILGLGGNDNLDGGADDDLIFGGKHDDTIQGGLGDDLVIGGADIDRLDGGAGSDTVLGGAGSDSYHYNVAENEGDHDVFGGGRGHDTVTLELSEAHWLDPAFQADLAELWAVMGEDGWSALGVDLNFASLELELLNVNTINILVDGKDIDIADEAVDAADDALAIFTSEAVVSGGVLANDDVPDFVASLEVSVQGAYGTAAFDADGRLVYTLDADHPAVAGLGDAENVIDHVTYVVTDADGDTDSATVAVTIAGGEPFDGTLGFRMDGQFDYGFLGDAAAGGGDINGDGLSDIVIGGDLDRATVIFGTAGGRSGVFDQTTLDGSDGFVMDNGENLLFGSAVSILGDFNADGLDDIVVSDKTEGQGRVYVVYGRAAPFDASLDVHDLSPGEGFALFHGSNAVAELGNAVSSAGDINADGIADLFVGSLYGDDSSFVLFGRDTATEGDMPTEFDLDTLDGSDGFRLSGPSGSLAGAFGGSAGDLNGDGIDDLVAGAEEYIGASGNWVGAAYVVFGHANGFAPDIDLEALDGTDGFRLETNTEYEGLGYGVEALGDVNGDGTDDILVGTYDGAQAYVLFGRNGSFDAVEDVNTLDGSDGFAVSVGSATTWSLGSAGDVNDDGFADFLIGTYSASYLVFGRRMAMAARSTWTR